MIATEKQRAKIDALRMCAGKGNITDGALCVMQMVDCLTTGKTSDHPQCASALITPFMISWNDKLPDDATRDRLLRPLLPIIINTRTTDADDLTRSWLAYDWLVRTQMAAWMRLTPSLVVLADSVAALEPITSQASLDLAWPTIREARDASRAAGDAAGAAAGDAAGAAAGAAAWAAARVAAWAAAGAALAETVASLQLSAQDLVRRMCEVGREVAS